MRKSYWLLTVFIFIFGIAIGVAGYMVWETSFQPEANSPNKDNAAKVAVVNSDLPDYTLPDLNVTGNDVGIGNSLNGGRGKEAESNPITIAKAEQEKILSDYKLALGILFDAWKVKDIPAFRSLIASAYTGELMESHVRKAEKFLPRGIGLYVTDIKFDLVDIEAADKYSATVNAIYRYTVRDYDLNKGYPFGEEVNHFVHVRANLVKIESRWMITGETGI